MFKVIFLLVLFAMLMPVHAISVSLSVYLDENIPTKIILSQVKEYDKGLEKKFQRKYHLYL
ncbi:hypothetical protein Psal006b_02343 [Piscirickettsia salmonis]|uniref:Fibronectin-binding protein n=1 Tax=Piscirickettsia salmonis TaxID=1238 RepID=A0A1L6TA58_PISSA|nr:hypothetical protein [Piscirickettsia salmonis]AKP73337.1 hypothetical protein PSLF89_1410 [Piscirickettsia salmonis LF-89 = ATCC VR-1361]ALB22047.1 fibronectin-binding protein [Piscirickettsia salmonis]ALY02185.1 hypothetical protein AWE47_04390 [Piscirickettsia salmonis]AMA41698.1 hypothetical protein AWJ11_04380 [Piscirickettsia salmonis]AOS34179.1 hypothetical protein AVM72_01615 [Piscirickettsia salmonis]